MRGCAIEVAYPNVLVAGDLVVYPAMHVSGQPATVIVNSIINSLLMRAAWCGSGAYVLGQFDRHVSLITYGDDNVQGVSDVARSLYNFKSIHDYLARFDIEFTPADKTSPSSAPFRKLSEVTFLKRTFVYWAHMDYWVPPLDKKSIIGPMMVWVRSEIPPDQHFVAAALSARDEALAWGEEYFHYIVKGVLEIATPDILRLLEHVKWDCFKYPNESGFHALLRERYPQMFE
jgi:hypothetical protein